MEPLERYEHWRKTLADLQGGRTYFRDQTPESVAALVRLAHDFDPSVIIEIGTNYGLSTRAWLEGSQDAEIVLIDFTFNPLRKSDEVLPIDWDRLTLVEKDVQSVILDRLWDDGDVVLMYFDCHGEGPIKHMLSYVGRMPLFGVIAVDDMWYSKEQISGVYGRDPEEFFQEVVIKQVDPNCPVRPTDYAHYWKGGSFYGFSEVRPLLEYINTHRIELQFDPDVKLVWWKV